MKMTMLTRKPSSCSSINSCKSVSFDDSETVYYTHSSNDYDRTAVDEPRGLFPALGEIYLSEPEQAVIENPQQDTLVERNTFANGRRSTSGYAVLLSLRSRSCK